MRKEGKQLCYGRGMFHACLPIGYFGNQCSILTCLVWHFYVLHKQIISLWKILSEHVQVGSYFEGIVERNITVQSEFECDAQFKNNDYFKNFEDGCMCWREW